MTVGFVQAAERASRNLQIDEGAQAHLRNYLESGEQLIWAERAVSRLLAIHYIGRILQCITGFLLLAIVLFFFFAYYLQAPLWIAQFAIAIVFLIMLFLVIKFLLKLLNLRSHYYGLTNRRALVAIGRYAPKSFTGRDFEVVWPRGSKKSGKRGRIHLCIVTNKEHEPSYKYKYTFYGVKNAPDVAALIRRQLLKES